ncbi:hypothetical protein [Janthinobacterium sp.]|uniref:hypothetical protein n=1 Tax=Janthinobacterium sp. TaxID=1871054 RepID=UPI00260AD82E|nr:hypothetical protein [Janthinobacterium sp.]
MELAGFMRYDFLGVMLLEVHDSAQAVFLPGAGDFASEADYIDKTKKSRRSGMMAGTKVYSGIYQEDKG